MAEYDNTNKGNLWIKTAKSGLIYKSGTINVEGIEYKITMFDNDKQGNDKRPDFNIKIEKMINDSQTNKITPQTKLNEFGDVDLSSIPF